jgi:hypothetical protein
MVDNFYFVEDLAFVFWFHLALVDDLWIAKQGKPSFDDRSDTTQWTVREP